MICYLKEECFILDLVGNLWLSKGSKGSDQGIVIFCVCCFYGHINDVDWVLPGTLQEIKEKSERAHID